MKKTTTHRMTTVICIAGLAFVLLAGAPNAEAQYRAEEWQFEFGLLYQLGTDIDFEGGSAMETNDDFGLELMAGYNINEKLETTFGMQWTSTGYSASVVDEDGQTSGIRGSYDTWALQANLIYNFSEGSFTPYIGAGIGYTWIDTNIPNGLPSTGCWWDPWWGWVCSTYYPTKTTSSFSYQAMLGVRYEFNMNTFMRLGYTSQWLDLGQATSTPRFDVFKLGIGWIF